MFQEGSEAVSAWRYSHSSDSSTSAVSRGCSVAEGVGSAVVCSSGEAEALGSGSAEACSEAEGLGCSSGEAEVCSSGVGGGRVVLGRVHGSHRVPGAVSMRDLQAVLPGGADHPAVAQDLVGDVL
ncbi:hypothetical protein SA13R_01545, partial [Rothia kristinae]